MKNDYSKLFPDTYSSQELRLQLFRLGERIPMSETEERKKIFEAYKKAMHKALDREIDESIAMLSGKN